MNFKFEYDQDIVIDGHNCVLNFVENLHTAKNHIIRRHFISSDLKFRTFRDQVLPLPVAPAAPAEPAAPAQIPVVIAPDAPKPAVLPENPVPEMPPPLDEDTAPAAAPEADEKKGLLGRMFKGKKGKKKG